MCISYYIPDGLQKSNSLVSWGLNTAESSVQVALETTLPAVIVLERPITLIDSLLCKSLDVVEERVPVVTLPPHMVSVKSELVFVSFTNFQMHPPSYRCSVSTNPNSCLSFRNPNLYLLFNDSLKLLLYSYCWFRR